jgi:hypothetical protein
MKMYCLYPNSFDAIFFVMSDSKENAFDVILKRMKKEDEKLNFLNCEINKKYNLNEININLYEKFYKNDVNVNNLPDEYTLEEYDMNEVYIGEIS